MAEIASWNGGSETEDKTSGGDKYVSRKNGSPSEISIVAELNAFVGCDVRNEALKFVDDAHAGSKGYFYMGGKKLIPCQLMLTEAVVSETTIAPDGTWLTAKVKLTMKQCGNYSGSAGSTSSGSGGASSSKKTSAKTTGFWSKVSSAVQGAIANAKSAVLVSNSTTEIQRGLSYAQSVIDSAKKVSAATKKLPVASKAAISTIKAKVKTK